jgi:glycosyltransferase involved in cell wall biosynthesis
MKKDLKVVAIASPDLTTTGGLRSVVEFMYETVEASGIYRPQIVSLATSANDRASRRIRDPGTWIGSPLVIDERDGELSWKHVGSPLAEIEWARYWRHRRLSRIFAAVDLVQIVAGTPAWGLCARTGGPPVCLQVATLAKYERGTFSGPALLQGWRQAMTAGTNILDKRGLGRMDHVFVENRQMMELATKLAPGRASFMYPGIDARMFFPAQQYARDGHILSVGRLGEQRKNWALLFNAYGLATRIDPGIPGLVIAGRGSLSPQDEAALGAAGIADRCTIVAGANRSELANLYRTASLFVVSSREEGLGLAVLEAMSSGLPVVASDLVGTAESVVHGTTGYLVAVETADATTNLRDAIVKCRRSVETRTAMGSAGRQRFLDVFSPNIAAAHVLDTYEHLLRSRLPGTSPKS